MPDNTKLPVATDPSAQQPPRPGSDAAGFFLAEATPPLLTLHHRESIVCYQADPDVKGGSVIKTRIELRRGTNIILNTNAMLKLGNRTFLPIAGCEIEPQAVGLYVRQEQVIHIPAGAESIPGKAVGKLNLRKIKRANKAGKPVMEIAGLKLEEGIVFRVSSVHHVTPADPGSGIIDADGSEDYYLVAECPQVPDAAGLFVQVPEFSPLDEDSYTKEIENLHAKASLPRTQTVVVTPKESAESAYLFQETSMQDKKAARKRKPGELAIGKKRTETLPAGTELVVESAITFSAAKEFFRIVECPLRPQIAGMFLLAKEVTPIQDSTSPSTE